MFTHVIYHKACLDGFASAYIIWKLLGNKPKYIPISYYDEPPDIKNSRIIVCDFSFDYNTTKNYIKNNIEFYNIDHHKTAIDNLKKIKNDYKYFDIDHSGAYLTWDYFFPNKEMPKFIKLIEDYDLWKFNYEDTEKFILALNQLPFNFKLWEKLEDPKYLKKLIENGGKLLNYRNSLINIIIKSFKIKSQIIDNIKYKIAYLNSNLFKNELGNKIVTEYDCDFSVIYNYDDNKKITKFSLRSMDNKTDVSKIAKLLGGGGHRNAAGITKSGLHNSII